MKKIMLIPALLVFFLSCGNTVMDAYKDRWGNEDLNPRMNNLIIESSDSSTITLAKPILKKMEDPYPEVKAYIGYDGTISVSDTVVTGNLSGPIDVSMGGFPFPVPDNDHDYRIIVVATNAINDSFYDIQQIVVPRTNIHVSPNGNDANPGTRFSPKLTIQAGIAVVTYATKVKVAMGTYNIDSQINMVEGRTLEGAWNADFSSRDLAYNSTILNEKRDDGATVGFNAISSSTGFDGFIINSGYVSMTVSNGSSPVIRNNTLFLRKGAVDSGQAFGITISGGSSPLIFNNVLVGGVNYLSYLIFISSGTASCMPRIYNNTIIVGRGNYRQWAMALRVDGGPSSYPYLKNNIFTHYYAFSQSPDHSIYHMDSGSGHYPYCYTTNLFYMTPYADGLGNYIYYGSAAPNNVNQLNYPSQVVSIQSGTARVLTYNDAAWRNIVDQDPLLVDKDNNNFHLSDSSPAKTSGTDLSVEVPDLTYDRDGNPRTAPWSIGAYENDN